MSALKGVCLVCNSVFDTEKSKRLHLQEFKNHFIVEGITGNPDLNEIQIKSVIPNETSDPVNILGAILAGAEQTIQLPDLINVLDKHSTLYACLDAKNYDLFISLLTKIKDNNEMSPTNYDYVMNIINQYRGI